jgi:hypothetical protein
LFVVHVFEKREESQSSPAVDQEQALCLSELNNGLLVQNWEKDSPFLDTE